MNVRTSSASFLLTCLKISMISGNLLRLLMHKLLQVSFTSDHLHVTLAVIRQTGLHGNCVATDKYHRQPVLMYFLQLIWLQIQIILLLPPNYCGFSFSCCSTVEAVCFVQLWVFSILEHILQLFYPVP